MSVLDKFLDAIRLNDDFDDDDEFFDDEDLEVLKEEPEKDSPAIWQIILICVCVLAVGVFVGVTINKKRSR